MTPPIRIANCSGFFGDRLSAAREMVEDGEIDVLTGDWLAELTMLILSRIRAKRPGAGYAQTFVTQMEQVMGTCLERGIKVVSNAGGLDPEGCAKAVTEVAARLGLAPKIAYIGGDDLMPRLDAVRDSLVPFDGPLGNSFISANAYLGSWGITEALRQGADIVVTGRVTDAAVVVGPAAWHHGWQRDNWNELAGAVVAGHVIECGAQATGGNYSFFEEIPADGRRHLGFPWAEVAEDGSCVIGKHEVAGGIVNIGTVTSQLLYEIGGPAYLGPDVTARFDTINVTEMAPNRVQISGVQGEPPPPTLKVATNELGGFRNSFSVALTGLDIEAKAAFAQEAFWDACPWEPEDFESVTSVLSRTDKVDPATNEQATASWRLTVKDTDDQKVGRAFSNAVIETALTSIPGFYSLTPPPAPATPFGVFRAGLIPAALVPQQVHMLKGNTVEVSSVAPPGDVVVTPVPGPSTRVPSGPTTSAPLGRILGTRSGDKGGNANLGVFARSDQAWAWLDSYLTTDRLQELLPETAAFEIERHRFGNLLSLNFLIFGLLEEGVAASTRRDAQAKSLGEWLRSKIVAIPDILLEE